MAAIDANGLELQDLDAGYWFEIVEGGLDGSPRVRGENYTIPGAAGQTWAPKQAHEWPLTLRGVVHGDGVDPETSYTERMDALNAVFDPTEDPFSITLHPDAKGVGGKVPTGGTATMAVVFLRKTGPPAQGDQVRIIELECVGITEPLGWTVDAGGS